MFLFYVDSYLLEVLRDLVIRTPSYYERGFRQVVNIFSCAHKYATGSISLCHHPCLQILCTYCTNWQKVS